MRRKSFKELSEGRLLGDTVFFYPFSSYSRRQGVEKNVNFCRKFKLSSKNCLDSYGQGQKIILINFVNDLYEDDLCIDVQHKQFAHHVNVDLYFLEERQCGTYERIV